MVQENGDAQSFYLVRVYTVTAYAAGSLQYRFDFGSGLGQLVRNDQSDVARTDHEYALSGKDSELIHQGLYGTRPVNSGEIVVVELQKSLRSARSHKESFRIV